MTLPKAAAVKAISSPAFVLTPVNWCGSPPPDGTVYRADNLTKTKCPLCGKYMLLVNGKRGRMLSCQDRACGHRQPEKENEYGGLGRSKGNSRLNQKLIAEYCEDQNVGSNLGDLFKAALAKKEQ